MLKGTGRETGIAAGLGAFLGHLFPVWLGFRGGKGVATYIGIALGWHWPAALTFGAIWLGVAVLSRYSSLSALVASAALPSVLAILGDWAGAGLFALMTLLVYLRHGANIGRLIRGEESKIGGS